MIMAGIAKRAREREIVLWLLCWWVGWRLMNCVVSVRGAMRNSRGDTRQNFCEREFFK